MALRSHQHEVNIQGDFMSSTLQPNNKNGNRVAFLREFLRHPQQVASIIPSSRFLERRMIVSAGIRTAHTVVELGAGTGGTTRAILRELPANGRLLVIEINSRFCALLRRIQDARLIIHRGSALELPHAIALHGLPAPDVIVSGIPFSTMSHSAGARIMQAVTSALDRGGRFVAYQVSKQVDDLASPLFGAAQVELELFNIPPMRVYRWEKQAV
jgi:phospholipid N-methyltransferase